MKRRNKKHRTGSSGVTFNDLLFNMILGLMMLFVISFLLINPKKKSETTVKTKAEFIITVTWEKTSQDDVDCYLKDPLGNIVYFNAREIGVMHLDRDDMGKRTDIVRLPNGKVLIVEDNREVITLRGVVAGEYILNVHMYNKEEPLPTEVTVTVDKINPYSTIVSKSVTLSFHGDEKTICRFKLDPDGNVVDINYLPKRLTGELDEQYYNGEDQ